MPQLCLSLCVCVYKEEQKCHANCKGTISNETYSKTAQAAPQSSQKYPEFPPKPISNNLAQIQIPDVNVDTYKFPSVRVCLCVSFVYAQIYMYLQCLHQTFCCRNAKLPCECPPPLSHPIPTGASAARQRLTSTTLFSFAIVDIVISPSPSSSPLPLPAHSQYVFIQFAKHFHKIFPQEKH